MLSMSPSKRRDTDMMKLMMSDFEVHIPDESSMHDFLVAFPGPEDTPYTGGVWKVHVTLPKEYPFKSPSIGFENRMFHPNVDEMSGSVCLDVINQTWSPMFDLVNIFKLFIPQLLSYPNPTDPLNGEAAALLMRDPEAYAGRIRDCVRLYASDPVHLDGTPVIVATANPDTNANNASASSSGGGDSDGGSSGGASASASASGVGGGGGGSSGGRSNSIGSDTSGISGISSSSGISGSSDELESSSSSEDKPPATAAADDNANADRGGDSSGGSGSGGNSSRRDNNGDNEGDCQGDDNNAAMGDGGKAGDVKRRDSTAGNGGGSSGENSCRSSSSSEFMMEMDMDETASDVSALSDVDG